MNGQLQAFLHADRGYALAGVVLLVIAAALVLPVLLQLLAGRGGRR